MLFNETIASDIAHGAPDASREQTEEAARSANACDFIMGFPEGFDTPVGERGAQLSGGQKQRVAIARAPVKKPEVRSWRIARCLPLHFIISNCDDFIDFGF